MEIPIKLDDLGVPPFSETPLWRFGTCSSWWFFTNPFEKYLRQIESFPQGSR